MCKSEHQLEFAHIKPRENGEPKIWDVLLYSTQKLLLEASKCFLLCDKCHIDYDNNPF